MKPTLKITTLIVAMLLLFSCKKKDTDLLNGNSCSAAINDNSWTPNSIRARSYKDTMISIGIEITKKDRFKNVYVDESLVFLVEKKFTRQTLTRNYEGVLCQFFIDNDEGHAPSETFEVLESADNWFVISEANDDFSKIKGNFEVTLIKTDSATAPYRYPDTLVYKNGTFDISY